jgi:outer membrane cobalamin receptor
MTKTIFLGVAILFATGAHAAEPAATEGTEQKAAQAAHPRCLQQTGSRIKTTEERPCVNASGQVITREQIEGTGATDTADALRRLSPVVN